MRHAVSFLKHIYESSVPDLANILVAEAEGNTKLIVKYLETVRGFVDSLIEECTNENSDRQESITGVDQGTVHPDIQEGDA